MVGAVRGGGEWECLSDDEVSGSGIVLGYVSASVSDSKFSLPETFIFSGKRSASGTLVCGQIKMVKMNVRARPVEGCAESLWDRSEPQRAAV